MALAAADLLSPKGILTMSLFPKQRSNQVKVTLTGWIAQATAERPLLSGSDLDSAVRAFCYWRAYFSAWQDANNAPASVSREGKGSTSYGQDQINALLLQAQRWEQEWIGTVTQTDDLDDASGSVETKVVW